MSQPLTDDSIMPFGKFKGRELVDVPAEYLLRIRENPNCLNDLKIYIDDNRDALELEIKNRKPWDIVE